MKKLIALLLALVMVLSLAACGGSDEPATTEASAPTDDPTEDSTEAAAAGYTEAPYITNLGTYGNVEDRLPVEGDIFVSPLNDGRRAMDKELGWFHACSAYPTSDLKIKIPII